MFIYKMLEMDGMIGTLELVAKSDWCAILPAALCDLDLSGDFRLNDFRIYKKWYGKNHINKKAIKKKLLVTWHTTAIKEALR